MQNARSFVARVARATMFAGATVALGDCGSTAPTPMYGGACLANPDACAIPQDAAGDVSSVPFYGGSCPGNFCPDASADAGDEASDAADDAALDAASDAD